ncbi:MAG: hypothetical protein JOY54_14840 [Acidobacteriaceae bacterium]|nr:hypothetical protein [Acidobacteriaceae bacterium]
MSLADFVNVLQSYAGASASAPPANTQGDFAKVSQAAPQPHLADAIAEAFRSNQTPAFPQMLATLFNQSDGQQRAGILSQLLSAGGGSLSGPLLQQFSGLLRNPNVTPEQANQVSASAVQQLAEHAQTKDPSIVDRASQFYAQHPTVVQALGAGALALMMSHLSKRV